MDMVRFSIRCHSLVPAFPDELERWLEEWIGHLRADLPQGIIRMSRLTQGLPSGDVEIGWLVDLELPDGEPMLARDRMVGMLAEIRLLGLHPTLLAPHDGSVNVRAPVETSGAAS
jgi:hypothetical protein